MQITMEGKYRTRDGRAVRILCIDGPEKEWPVCGVIDGNKEIDSWNASGNFGIVEREQDLVPVPTKHEGWIYISPSENGTRGPIFFTREQAIFYNERMRRFRPSDIALAHVTWED